jgi:Cu(I)/Ag(I) efflux system membrane fusion protein
MNRVAQAGLATILVAAGLGAGYWWGTRTSVQPSAPASTTEGKAERKVLYYRNPMGLDDTSSTPKKDSMGMDYIPVYADEPAASSSTGKGKILYYRNPMGLPDTSPVPKKDSMGMDYVPVYEGDEAPAGTVKIAVDRVQKLGVRTEAASVRELTRTVRAVGTFQPDERRLRTVSPKFEGWIQRLLVNATGQAVRRGDPLMEVYSPELVSAQQEYAIAVKGVQTLKDADPATVSSMQRLVDSALQRLRYWDISEPELNRLVQDPTARPALALRSPTSGVVLEKPSVEGMRFMPGEVLYRIADLSSLWLLGDVFEQDLASVQTGQAVRIKVDAYPDREFSGKVSFVYPTVSPETRTAKVRIDVPNAHGLLKPSMYASLELLTGSAARRMIAVPDSAVLDTGTRQVVLVQRGEGLYEPREVRTGTRGDGYVQIRDGLKDGERVVVSANFLIDAESNLKAALSGFGSGKASGDSSGGSSRGQPAEASSAGQPAGHAGHGSGR